MSMPNSLGSFRRRMATLVGLIALPLALSSAPGKAASPKEAAPARVITLAPHITELMFAAGAGAKVIATINSSDHPAPARDLPRVGDGVQLNIEAVLAHHPDVLLAWAPTHTLRALLPTLSASGITLQYSQPAIVDEVPDEILRFGQLFGTQETAIPFAAELRQRLQALRSLYADRPPVSVFLDLGDTPLMTLGDDTLFNSVLALCGGVNLYVDTGLPAPQVSAEGVLSRNPNVVLVAASVGGSMRQTPWKALGLPAALRNNLYAVNPDTLLRPGPRLIEAAEDICRHIDEARRQ